MQLLKPGAYVIVISRGKIIDEEALIDGLRSGKIAGAGLDVMAQEPLPADSPLWDMDNVVLIAARLRPHARNVGGPPENLQGEPAPVSWPTSPSSMSATSGPGSSGQSAQHL